LRLHGEAKPPYGRSRTVENAKYRVFFLEYSLDPGSQINTKRREFAQVKQTHYGIDVSAGEEHTGYR
jgi:hypothetical protein